MKQGKLQSAAIHQVMIYKAQLQQWMFCHGRWGCAKCISLPWEVGLCQVYIFAMGIGPVPNVYLCHRRLALCQMYIFAMGSGAVSSVYLCHGNWPCAKCISLPWEVGLCQVYIFAMGIGPVPNVYRYHGKWACVKYTSLPWKVGLGHGICPYLTTDCCLPLCLCGL